MSKTRKPESRRPSKKKLQKMEQKRKEAQEFCEEAARYSRPTERSEAAIEACKQRVNDGKLCYCKEKCRCRDCQESRKENGSEGCILDFLKKEGGCILGCCECSECNPCY